MGQGFHNVLGVGAGDDGLDARVLFKKSAEHARENVLRHGHGGTDAERAGGFAAQAAEGGAGFFSEARAFAGVAEQNRAGVGEANAAFAAVEEGGAEFFFEGVNLLADGGLAEAEAVSGAAEAGFFGDGAEDLQPEIFHDSTVAGSLEPGAGGWKLVAGSQ